MERFIRVALEWFGFGPVFMDMVDLIFNQIETAVINSGTTSTYFNPERGIRQGCCVSPYLFILVVEVMASCIRQNEEIAGLMVGNQSLTITQFADDSTCLLSRQDSLVHLLSFMQTFSTWSGLVINKAKSMILFPNGNETGLSDLQGIPVVTRVKILGVWFTSQCSTNDHYQLNFKPQLLKIKSVCSSWNTRTLSLKGKATLVNSLMISLLQYQISSLATPPQVFKEYRKIITDFIWNGRKPKVAYSTLILPVAQGGLHLMDLEVRVKVSSLQWVRRLIMKPSSNAASTLSYLLQTEDLTRCLSYKKKEVPEGLQHLPFYSQMFRLWNCHHAFDPPDETSVRREIMWNNKFVTISGAPFYWKSWASKDILSIGDICHEHEGRLLSHTEITNKFGIRCSFLDALQIRMAIPLVWRQSLSNDWRRPIRPASDSGIDILLPKDNPTDIASSGPKAMYRAFILEPNSSSTAYKRWSEAMDSPLHIANFEEWKELNLNVYRATRETKLQSLHFRILNRILPCNKFLKQIRIKTSDACDLCGQVDSDVHFLFECPVVQTFWISICNWFDRVEDLSLGDLNQKQFFFGVPQTFPKAKVVNLILMTVKFFVYRQRLFHGGTLELVQWLREFKCKLLNEKYIHQSEGKLQRFRIWYRILNALG